MATAKVPEPIKKCKCGKAKWVDCKHSWVARYYDGAKRQREESYPWNRKEECRQFLLKVTQAKVQGDWVDPTHGRQNFCDVLDRWVESRRAESTKAGYRSTAKLHIRPYLGHLTLAAVASLSGRDAVEELVTVTLPDKGLGASRVSVAYNMICATLNDAHKRGQVAKPHVYGIQIAEVPHRAEIIWLDYRQLSALVDGIPADYQLAVWLMRGAGLRLGEALGVSRKCLRDKNTVLRVSEQMMAKGRVYGPLKHRRKYQFRDIPVAPWLADMILAHETVDEEGHLFPLIVQQTFSKWFTKARNAAGVTTKFTPHHLRHIFASVCLERLVPITDVSKWLGHKDINMTYAIYGHITPSGMSRAVVVLAEEYEEWKQA